MKGEAAELDEGRQRWPAKHNINIITERRCRCPSTSLHYDIIDARFKVDQTFDLCSWPWSIHQDDACLQATPTMPDIIDDHDPPTSDNATVRAHAASITQAQMQVLDLQSRDAKLFCLKLFTSTMTKHSSQTRPKHFPSSTGWEGFGSSLGRGWEPCMGGIWDFAPDKEHLGKVPGTAWEQCWERYGKAFGYGMGSIWERCKNFPVHTLDYRKGMGQVWEGVGLRIGRFFATTGRLWEHFCPAQGKVWKGNKSPARLHVIPVIMM